jgi:uncharacterized protein (DUF58 family)
MARRTRDKDWIQTIDWGRIAPLRLRARSVADGVFAGTHRSRRRGPGVEFGGHRPYTPGDDLRWIDRHALMRHDRLIVRMFETETDRGLHLMMDATASMAFRGLGAPGAKVSFAALIAAALARVALTSGDPVSLDWIGGRGVHPVPPSSSGETFDRIVGALSSLKATGDALQDPESFERALQPVARRARRGATIVLFSDLIDLPEQASERFATLGTQGRRLAVVQVLDREELTLPYSGTVRLAALEGDAVVETNADATRERYLQALDNWTARWTAPLAGRGGRWLRAATDEDPVEVVRSVLRAISEVPA